METKKETEAPIPKDKRNSFTPIEAVAKSKVIVIPIIAFSGLIFFFIPIFLKRSSVTALR